MEGSGEGCGFFSSVKLPYLSTMSQQFCRRLLVNKGFITWSTKDFFLAGPQREIPSGQDDPNLADQVANQNTGSASV